MAQYDTAGIFNLVVEEFTKVLHVHLALVGVDNCSKAVENGIAAVFLDTLHSADDIAEFANA